MTEDINIWHATGGEKVPSWSWIGYTGGIEYLAVSSRDSQRTHIPPQRHGNATSAVRFRYTPEGYCILVARLLQQRPSCRSRNTSNGSVPILLETEKEQPVGYIRYHGFTDASQDRVKCIVIQGSISVAPRYGVTADDWCLDFAYRGEYLSIMVVERLNHKNYRRRGIGFIDKMYLEPVEEEVYVY